MALFRVSTATTLRTRVEPSVSRSRCLSSKASFAVRPVQRAPLRQSSLIWSRSKVTVTTADLKNSAEADTWQNKLTEFMAKGPINGFKKFVAKQQAGDYDPAEIKSSIDTYVNDNKVMVFSFSTCPFCAKAKDTLTEKGVEFTAVELDQVEQGMAIRCELGELTGRTSVPNIFIGGECIGGCNDGSPGLMPLIAEGKLEAMISK